MFQVRIRGRGGQGVVTAAEMLSSAAFLEGRHAQAFPASARSARARGCLSCGICVPECPCGAIKMVAEEI